MRTIGCLIVVLVMQVSSETSFADDVIVEQEMAAAGKKPVVLPFRFTLQKAGFKYDGYRVWGKVTDADGKPPRHAVTIVFTAYDPKGKFLARATTSVGNEDSDGGRLGHINDLSLATDGVIPAKIVWKTVSENDPYSGIKVVKSTDKTASDTALTFEVQRIGSGYRGMTVWGKVSNATMLSFENVEVIVTAYDASGKFLGRGRTSVNPSKIEPGQISYVDSLGMEIGKKAPAKLEWKVIQSRF